MDSSFPFCGLANDWCGGDDAVWQRECRDCFNGDQRSELCGAGEDVVKQLLERVCRGNGSVDDDSEHWERNEWGFNVDD